MMVFPVRERRTGERSGFRLVKYDPGSGSPIVGDAAVCTSAAVVGRLTNNKIFGGSFFRFMEHKPGRLK
jgi:hypothetical protein